MLSQIQIHTAPSASNKEKGDFFEDLLRQVMETQRYRVTQQIRFTGTEIDLLCEHMDRPSDTALVECKARPNIVASDIKSFVSDVIVFKRAEYGFFVHTSELLHEAAGMVVELKKGYPRTLVFWGPDKVIELLQYCRLVKPLSDLPKNDILTPTKRILLYTYLGRFWITVFSNKVVPTHYYVVNAFDDSGKIDEETMKWISGLDELQGLSRIDSAITPAIVKPDISLDAVAEIQEAEQWDDYRPVGTKFFVGRKDIRHRLYQFIQTPLTGASSRRVFFVESKSGWGKSSLLAELRARSRNRRNKNLFYVLAVDSRSANTSEFVSLAVAKLVAGAAKNGFIPEKFSGINITSAYDTLASPEMQNLLSWLKENNRVLVLIFDQFEDLFRKENLFRTFHKLMMDVHDQQGPFILGFSWKSEINIPIDNPAYNLWQQARTLAEVFRLDEFLGCEVDRVLRQLEQLSGHRLPADLRRRLKESSQGFPWFTKKLSIHCYHQMQKGATPEDLVDQNLNVKVLFDEDNESISADEARALKLIAKRGYEGNSLDVAEVDDKVQEQEINSLLGKRLIVRSGAKYNVYWDIFRDFLVEGKPPILGESFLLRQYPAPCARTLGFLLDKAPAKIENMMTVSEPIRVKKGTLLNWARELRHLGAVTKAEDHYLLRPSIKSLEDFKVYMNERLNSHIVVRTLRSVSADIITQEHVINALRENFKGYGFAPKTWATYANYLIAWLRYSGIDLGHRLISVPTRVRSFTPQLRPEKDIAMFLSLKDKSSPIVRPKNVDKELYDLKALELLYYEGRFLYLTKRGLTLLKQDDLSIRKEIARLALLIPKIQAAYVALRESQRSDGAKFDELLAPALDSITSASYREVTTNVLKAWAKFISTEVAPA